MKPEERILDLLALLLVARRPVPLSRVFTEFEMHYAGSSEARDRKFSRDKETLRELGIPLLFIEPNDEDEEGGYVVDHARTFMPEIELSPEEQAMLYAVGAAAQASAFPMRQELARALTKLQASALNGGVEGDPVISANPPPRPAFAAMMADAVVGRRRLRLVYPPETEERLVDPYAFKPRAGRFFLVGFCHLRQGIRTFASDRLSACRFDNTKSTRPQFEPPADFDLSQHLPVYPSQLRVHEPISVELTFEPKLAESGPRVLGVPESGVFDVTNVEGLASQLLMLGAGVSIVRPVEAKIALERMINSLLAAHGDES